MGDELKLIWHSPRCHCISSRLHECDDAVPYALHCLWCLTMVDASQYEMKVWSLKDIHPHVRIFWVVQQGGVVKCWFHWIHWPAGYSGQSFYLACLPGLSFWSWTKTARLWLIGFRIRGQIRQDSDSHGKWRWPAISEVDKLRDFCREKAHCGMHTVRWLGWRIFPSHGACR